MTADAELRCPPVDEDRRGRRWIGLGTGPLTRPPELSRDEWVAELLREADRRITTLWQGVHGSPIARMVRVAIAEIEGQGEDATNVGGSQ